MCNNLKCSEWKTVSDDSKKYLLFFIRLKNTITIKLLATFGNHNFMELMSKENKIVVNNWIVINHRQICYSTNNSI